MAGTQIARDPFARATLIRRSEPSVFGVPCTWCGQVRKSGVMFTYAWVEDSINRQWWTPDKPFCSVDCWRTYNS